MRVSLAGARLALALVGVVVFGVGIRLDSPLLRWGAIALVAASLLLRFVSKEPPP